MARDNRARTSYLAARVRARARRRRPIIKSDTFRLLDEQRQGIRCISPVIGKRNETRGSRHECFTLVQVIEFQMCVLLSRDPLYLSLPNTLQLASTLANAARGFLLVSSRACVRVFLSLPLKAGVRLKIHRHS